MIEPPLLERLKNARAVQIGAVYMGACWFVVQLVSTIQEMLSLPAWIGPVTLVLLGVGFVVVMATAFVQARAATTAAEEAGEVPTDWEIAPADAIQSLRAGRLPHLTWGRAILGGVVALSLAIGAAGGYVLLNVDELAFRPTPAGASVAPQGVAVMPFTVNGPGLEPFGEGMVNLVSTNIDGIDGVRSVNPRTVMAEWNRVVGDDGTPALGEVLAAADATGARYAVVGDATSTGTEVRLNAELYDLSDGTSIGTGGAEGDLVRILALIDDMSIDLLRSLVAESGNQTATGIQRLDGLVTSSIEALSAYLEGEAFLRYQQLEPALEAYERAVAADSSFAMAWARIGVAYGWIGTEPQASAEANRRALEFASRLPAREVTLLRAAADVGTFTPTPGTLEALRRHVERFPDDPEGWSELGEYLLHMPRAATVVGPEEELAEALMTAVDLDPNFAPHYVHLFRYLAGVGDWRFFEYMEMYRGVVEERLVTRYQAQWDFLHGDGEVRAAGEAYYTENWSANFFGEILFRSDSTVERSIELLHLNASVPAGVEDTFVRPTLGQFDGLRAAADDPSRSLNLFLPAVLTNETIGEVSAEAAADSVIASAERARAAAMVSTQPQASNDEAAMETLAASVSALRDGAPGEAARVLLDASVDDGSIGAIRLAGWELLLGEALARTGRPEQAIRFYESNMTSFRALKRLRLGELHEDVGDREAAAENYRGFLRLYIEADPELQVLVERARAGLARVGG